MVAHNTKYNACFFANSDMHSLFAFQVIKDMDLDLDFKDLTTRLSLVTFINIFHLCFAKVNGNNEDDDNDDDANEATVHSTSHPNTRRKMSPVYATNAKYDPSMN